MDRFIREKKESRPEALLLRSPREEFERFVGRRLRTLEAIGEQEQIDRVMAALVLGRRQLSIHPGGQAGPSASPSAPSPESQE